MAAGAVFKLIANDGKSDRMIMATKLLNQRIKDVMCARKRAGKADITPTLVDLERTHILYVNAHFKPFAATGFEYNKVRPQSGNPQLNSGVTFSIPQFGDFFHDMVCRLRLGQVKANDGAAPTQPSALFPANVVGGNQYRLVDATGKQVIGGATYRNFVRYAEYPGNRAFSQVKFDVNGNPLDSYDHMVPTMLEKFCTAPNKRIGHDRLVGQETPLTGYGGLRVTAITDADAANTPTGIGKHISGQSNQTVGLFKPGVAGEITSAGTTLDTLNVAGGNFDVSRQLRQIVNGPQTPKPVQPPLEIWNKLRFWFNDDVRLSIASVSIPFGQRFITIELCDQNQLVFEVPSIFLETTTNANVVTYTPIFQKFNLTDLVVEKMELYINNIFVNPEVHDIYIKRIGFSLIRVYRQQVSRVNQDGSGEMLLSNLKWPIEYMFVGLRPSWNIRDASVAAGVVSGNQNKWRDWHRLTRMVDAAPGAADLTAVGGASSVGQIMPENYYLPVPTVDSLTLTSHGITIFDGFQDQFYNQYMPFHYGGQNINTPDDPGALFVNMALFPRSYQPSCHLNISRARETYIKWTTSYISAKTPADLLAVAVAINFLLITDGSAILRYST